MLTWRIRVYECDEFKERFYNQKKPLLLAHWHGDELALIHLVKKYKLATMVSHSKDGVLMNLILTSLGGVTKRGSSSRGGISALKGLVRLTREGHPTSLAVDGPRGPLHEVKPGVFELSKICEAPVFPLGVSVDRKYQFQRSWSKAILPKLFARVHILIEPPLHALKKEDDPKSPERANNLKERLFEASRQADKFIFEAPQK